MTLTNKIKILATLVLAGIAHHPAADADTQQRALFKDAYASARSGNATVLRDYQARLNGYILWPDLVSASYLGRLSKVAADDIESHLQRYPDTSLNRTLRHRHAVRLAKRGDTARFLALYERELHDAGDVELDCYAAHARLHSDDSPANRDRALKLWMVGKSQPDACDALFHRLRTSGLLTSARHGERLHLALASGNLKLAAFLARNAPAADVAWLDHWRVMRKDPDAALKRIHKLPKSPLREQLYAYGVKRAARKDPANAWAVLNATASRVGIAQSERDALARYTALQGARDGLLDAQLWVTDSTVVDDELARWQVRAALTAGDWALVLKNIDAMREPLRKESAWQYFRARALAALDQPQAAQAAYAQLALERSYYGFLAADRLDERYRFSHESVPDDHLLVARLMENREFTRARELYFVGLYGPARSEWEAAVNKLELPLRQQAALLADAWGWHSQAIRTLARSAGHNDLLRSYPTPLKEHFDETTTKADIGRTWAYGITRSESLFMSDVKSSAGAVGLMQLMPRTGKETARRARVPYRGLQSLLDPETNITLGVHYLGQMYNRFDHNQVLATAAYNAGPSRVRSWLPEGSNLPADVWIEAIPFNETRNYVKKVLFSDTVFYWRLTGSERRLAALMPPIAPRN